MTFIWLMYMADVVGSIGVILVISAFCCLMAYGAWAVHSAMESEPKPPFKLIVWALAFSAAASIIPSAKTMYTIAAVSVGREALSTPTGAKAVNALNHWLDKQTEKQPEKK